MLGASAGAGRFKPVIGRVVVNEIFHLQFPFVFAVHGAVQGAPDSLPLRAAGHR
jgi:hypothetical protein